MSAPHPARTIHICDGSAWLRENAPTAAHALVTSPPAASEMRYGTCS